jgi:hypothetical protein
MVGVLEDFRRFLSSPVLLPNAVEELVVKWFVGRLIEENLTIVSGFPACILNVLDEAVVPYDDVFELVAPYSVVAVKPELAEKIVGVMGREVEGARGSWFIPTCYIGGKCVYHVYNARNLDLDFIAKHIVILRHVNDLIADYIVFGRCKGESPADVFISCVGRLSNELVDIARRKGDELLVRVLSDPFKVYCTPDIVVRHISPSK